MSYNSFFVFILLISNIFLVSSLKFIEDDNTLNAYQIVSWNQLIEFDLTDVPSEVKDNADRMQNFYINGDYIYASVRFKGKSGVLNDNAILKFNYPSTGMKATYSGEMMIILSAGHAETLDMYEGYLVMGMGGSNSTKSFYSTEIGIFKFEAGKEIDTSEITRIINFNEAKMEEGKTVDIGKIRRVVAAVYNNLLSISITRDLDVAEYTWTTYDLNKISDFIKEQSGNPITCGEINQIEGAYLYSFDTGKNKKAGYASFQGLESFGDNLYVSSGFGGIDGKVEPGRITVFNRETGEDLDGYQLQNGNITIGENTYEIGKVETQGMQFINDNLYLLVDQSKKNLAIIRVNIK